MNRLPLPTGAKWVKPHQLGWLRRPEYDTKTGEAWEKPDGQMFIHEKQRGELMLVFMKHIPNLKEE